MMIEGGQRNRRVAKGRRYTLPSKAFQLHVGLQEPLHRDWLVGSSGAGQDGTHGYLKGLGPASHVSVPDRADRLARQQLPGCDRSRGLRGLRGLITQDLHVLVLGKRLIGCSAKHLRKEGPHHRLGLLVPQHALLLRLPDLDTPTVTDRGTRTDTSH